MHSDHVHAPCDFTNRQGTARDTCIVKLDITSIQITCDHDPVLNTCRRHKTRNKSSRLSCRVRRSYHHNGHTPIYQCSANRFSRVSEIWFFVYESCAEEPHIMILCSLIVLPGLSIHGSKADVHIQPNFFQNNHNILAISHSKHVGHKILPIVYPFGQFVLRSTSQGRRKGTRRKWTRRRRIRMKNLGPLAK